MTGRPVAQSADDLPDELPLFPLNGVLLLPRGRLPLTVFEPRYLAMVDHPPGHGRLIAIVQPEVAGTLGPRAPAGPGIYRTGCAARPTSSPAPADTRYRITPHAYSRVPPQSQHPHAGNTC